MLLLLMAHVRTVFGQETWNLQQCIDYALENNIQIKQHDLAVSYQQNLLDQAKSDRLPGLNGQLQQFQLGRSSPMKTCMKTAIPQVFRGIWAPK